MYFVFIGNVYNLLFFNVINFGFVFEKKIIFDKILYVLIEVFYLFIIWLILWDLVVDILFVDCLLNGDVIIVLFYICWCFSDKMDVS